MAEAISQLRDDLAKPEKEEIAVMQYFAEAGHKIAPAPGAWAQFYAGHQAGEERCARGFIS